MSIGWSGCRSARLNAMEAHLSMRLWDLRLVLLPRPAWTSKLSSDLNMDSASLPTSHIHSFPVNVLLLEMRSCLRLFIAFSDYASDRLTWCEPYSRDRGSREWVLRQYDGEREFVNSPA